MLIFDKLMPNYALGKFHRADKFEIVTDQTRVVVTSFPTEAMDKPCWQDTYVIPNSTAIVQSLADAEHALMLPNEPFDGATFLDPAATDLEAAKARKRGEIKASRDKAVSGGVVVPEIGTFDSDEISRSNINGAVTGAILAQAAGQPFSVYWTLADNTVVQLDGPQMLAVGTTVMAHVSAKYTIGQSLQALVEAAETVPEVLAITWPVEN